MIGHFGPHFDEVVELGSVLHYSLICHEIRKFLCVVWENSWNEACKWRVSSLIEGQLQADWVIVHKRKGVKDLRVDVSSISDVVLDPVDWSNHLLPFVLKRLEGEELLSCHSFDVGSKSR